jgi:hypothetical protein
MFDIRTKCSYHKVNRRLNAGEIKTIGIVHIRVVSITYLKLTHLCDLGRLWEMKKMKRTLAILAVLSLISTTILAEDLKKLSINDASFASRGFKLIQRLN